MRSAGMLISIFLNSITLSFAGDEEICLELSARLPAAKSPLGSSLQLFLENPSFENKKAVVSFSSRYCEGFPNTNIWDMSFKAPLENGLKEKSLVVKFDVYGKLLGFYDETDTMVQPVFNMGDKIIRFNPIDLMVERSILPSKPSTDSLLQSSL